MGKTINAKKNLHCTQSNSICNSFHSEHSEESLPFRPFRPYTTHLPATLSLPDDIKKGQQPNGHRPYREHYCKECLAIIMPQQPPLQEPL